MPDLRLGTARPAAIPLGSSRVQRVYLGTVLCWTAPPIPSPPAEPVLNPLTQSNGAVTVTWTAPANGGSPLTGYTLQRRLGAGEWITIANPGASATSYVDAKPGAGLFGYQLAASNLNGPSDYSAEVTITVAGSALSNTGAGIAGQSVTLTNSGTAGNAWDVVFVGTNASAVYETVGGVTAIRAQTGTLNVGAWWRWAGSFADQAVGKPQAWAWNTITISARDTVRRAAVFFEGLSGGVEGQVARVYIEPDGSILVQRANTTTVMTGPVVPVGADLTIGLRAIGHATAGEIEVRAWWTKTPWSTTPDWQQTVTGVATRGPITDVTFGVAYDQVNAVPWRYRAFGASDAGFPRAQVASLLRYTPAPLTNPITIKVTNSARNFANMSTTQDYIVLLPGAPGNDLQTTPLQTLGGFGWHGGRNVRIVGGSIRHDVDYIAQDISRNGNAMRSMYLQSWSGEMYLEGIELGGDHWYEGINISCPGDLFPNAKLVVQNIRMPDPLRTILNNGLKTGSVLSTKHEGGDWLQIWNGVAGGIYVDRITLKKSGYQGIFYQELKFGPIGPAEKILSRYSAEPWNPVNVPYPAWTTEKYHMNSGSNFTTARYTLFHGYDLPCHHEDVYLTPGSDWNFGRSMAPDVNNTTSGAVIATDAEGEYATFRNPKLTGRVRAGAPPTEFVPAGTVGVGYVTPGAASATVPGAPSSVVATGGSSSASVAFAAPANTGGSAITGYRVTSSPGGATATGTASPITVTGLTPGTAYTFTVAALNVIGYSAESAPSNSVTPVQARLRTSRATVVGVAPTTPDRSSLVPGTYTPDNSTTGRPVGSPALKLHSGSFTLSTAGAVYEDVQFNDEVRPNASNITFRRCLFRGKATATGDNWLVFANSTATGIVIDDCDFIPQTPNIWLTALYGKNFTARRNRFRDAVVDFVGINGPGVVLTGNYGSDMAYFTPCSYQSDNQTHNDAVQFHPGASNPVLRGNRWTARYGSAGSHQPSHRGGPTPSGAANPAIAGYMFGGNLGSGAVIGLDAQKEIFEGGFQPVNGGGPAGLNIGKIWGCTFDGDSFGGPNQTGTSRTIDVSSDTTLDAGEGTANQNVYTNGTAVTVRRNQ